MVAFNRVCKEDIEVLTEDIEVLKCKEDIEVLTEDIKVFEM